MRPELNGRGDISTLFAIISIIAKDVLFEQQDDRNSVKLLHCLHLVFAKDLVQVLIMANRKEEKKKGHSRQ